MWYDDLLCFFHKFLQLQSKRVESHKTQPKLILPTVQVHEVLRVIINHKVRWTASPPKFWTGFINHLLGYTGLANQSSTIELGPFSDFSAMLRLTKNIKSRIGRLTICSWMQNFCSGLWWDWEGHPNFLNSCYPARVPYSCDSTFVWE